MIALNVHYGFPVRFACTGAERTLLHSADRENGLRETATYIPAVPCNDPVLPILQIKQKPTVTETQRFERNGPCTSFRKATHATSTVVLQLRNCQYKYKYKYKIRIRLCLNSRNDRKHRKCGAQAIDNSCRWIEHRHTMSELTLARSANAEVPPLCLTLRNPALTMRATSADSGLAAVELRLKTRCLLLNRWIGHLSGQWQEIWIRRSAWRKRVWTIADGCVCY